MYFSKKISLLLPLLGLLSLATAQRVHFSQIEMQPNGLYYQVNTIPPFTGTAFEVHPPLGPKEKEKAKVDYEGFLKSGKKSEEVEFKEGKKHGKAAAYDQLGAKIFQATFVAGKKTGLEEQWYARGEKKLEVPFIDDKPNGIAIEWHKNGNKKSESLFKMGVEEGLHKWWFEDGSKDQEVNFIDGVVNGKVRNWYQNGQLKLDSDFKDGVHNGTTTEWHMNGQKKAEGKYIMGKEEGKFSAWAKSGQLLDEKIYDKGELIQTMDYRSAGIRTREGFTQVINELESNYLVKIEGKSVRAVNTRNIGFIVDDKIVQLVNAPIKAFTNGGENNTEILNAFKQSELKQATADYATKPETTERMMKTKTGQDALYWSFEVPKAKNAPGTTRRVIEEHFLAVVSAKDVLLLSSVVTDADRTEAITKLLEKVAATIEVKDGPIDLNAIRDAARK